MRFQTDDIIKSTGGNFSKVQAILGKKVVKGHLWTDMDGARKDQVIGYILTEAELATYTIVERNGKDYKPERWEPKEGELYYHPLILPGVMYACTHFNSDFAPDIFYLDNGLCYPFTEEGRQAAIARTKRMLAVK